MRHNPINATDLHPLAETGFQTAARYARLIVGDAMWAVEGTLAGLLIAGAMYGLLAVGAR